MGLQARGQNDPGRFLLNLFADDTWTTQDDLVGAVQPILTRLAATYLTSMKEDRQGTLRACDAVAHFHLSNGAQVERLNWLADRSANGMTQSCGLMVNYLYRLADIERHHEAYRLNGTINASSGIKNLSRS